jgi:hypothetical protein
MSVDLSTFVPMYIEQTLADTPQKVVTATRWNELWNLIITQGDYNAAAIDELCKQFTAVISEVVAGILSQIPDDSITIDKLEPTLESKILNQFVTDTVTSTKYKFLLENGVLYLEEVAP